MADALWVMRIVLVEGLLQLAIPIGKRYTCVVRRMHCERDDQQRSEHARTYLEAFRVEHGLIEVYFCWESALRVDGVNQFKVQRGCVVLHRNDITSGGLGVRPT